MREYQSNQLKYCFLVGCGILISLPLIGFANAETEKSVSGYLEEAQAQAAEGDSARAFNSAELALNQAKIKGDKTQVDQAFKIWLKHAVKYWDDVPGQSGENVTTYTSIRAELEEEARGKTHWQGIVTGEIASRKPLSAMTEEEKLAVMEKKEEKKPFFSFFRFGSKGKRSKGSDHMHKNEAGQNQPEGEKSLFTRWFRRDSGEGAETKGLKAKKTEVVENKALVQTVEKSSGSGLSKKKSQSKSEKVSSSSTDSTDDSVSVK